MRHNTWPERLHGFLGGNDADQNGKQYDEQHRSTLSHDGGRLLHRTNPFFLERRTRHGSPKNFSLRFLLHLSRCGSVFSWKRGPALTLTKNSDASLHRKEIGRVSERLSCPQIAVFICGEGYLDDSSFQCFSGSLFLTPSTTEARKRDPESHETMRDADLSCIPLVVALVAIVFLLPVGNWSC